MRVPPPGPAPTLIVNTSPGNHQFIYELDAEVSGEEIEAINQKLTGIVGGDTGHSRAKLLRLPGTYNVKPEYDPKPLVAILQKDGPVHRSVDLLRDARGAVDDKTVFEWVEQDLRKLSTDQVRDRYWRNLPGDVQLRLRQRKPIDAWAVRINGKRYTAVRDDRSEVVFQIGRALRDAGASPAEALAVIMDTCFWRSREADGKRENPGRLIAKIFTEDVAQPLAVDPADWADKPVPERVWLLDGWIPAGKVTGLYGDGATGKTTLALQLAVSVALGIEFLAMPVKQGRVYALLAENDPDDSHIALHEICENHEVTLAELRDRVRIASRAGLDNVLMSFEGRPQTTTLLQQLLTELKAFGPVLVILETAADLFGGNENDRGQVRSFLANCCSNIAIATGAAVLLCAHPSVAGLKSGEGSGGSTAWNNTLRSSAMAAPRLKRSRCSSSTRVSPPPGERSRTGRCRTVRGGRAFQRAPTIRPSVAWALGDEEVQQELESRPRPCPGVDRRWLHQGNIRSASAQARALYARAGEKRACERGAMKRSDHA